MKTFKELKNDVYEIAQATFGQLTYEVRQRLDSELDGIEKYGRTELFVTLWRLFMDGLKRKTVPSEVPNSLITVRQSVAQYT